jgi:hypothetical protein
MTTADELLASADIQEFLGKNERARPAVERAAEQLKDEPDAILSLTKILPALSDETIRIFFSFKKKDEETAKAVVSILREYSARRLDITFQAEFTEEIAGKQWRDKIRESVRPANWFILLLPDPSDDWHWCLFETGLFVAQRCSADRLICLHHPDTKIPSQIEDYHAVAATIPEMEQFIRMVFVNENPVPGMAALNPDVESKVPDIAKEIVDAIRPPKKVVVREIFEPWVVLKIDDAASLENEDDLDSARVVDANQAALDLFDFLKAPSTWKELRSEVSEEDHDSRWRKELFHVLRRIASGRKFTPVQAVFTTKDGIMHRPVACAIDRSGDDGPIDAFHIMFSEEIAAVDRSAMPKNLAVLADLLRFTFRFRWEVLEQFSEGPIEDEDVERLRNALDRIRADWESRHIGDENEIFGIFGEEQQQRFMQMSQAWREISNEEGTGKLDLALKNGDKDVIPGLLRGFLPMNQTFLEIAADLFSRLISGRP